MYYVKWHTSLPIHGLLHPYMREVNGIGDSPWVSLSKAMSFSSKLEAREYMKKLGCSHWLELTEIVFIHPLNFEERVKGDR